MKKNIFYLFTTLFIVFGLISCSLPTTKSDDNLENPTVKSMAIVRQDTVALQSLASGKYLCADLSYGPDAPLYVNRDGVGYDSRGISWEHFDLIEFDDGSYAIRAHATGKYVCAENNGTTRAVANRDWVQEWETFYVSIDVNRGGIYCYIKYPADYGKYFNYKTMIPDTKKCGSTCFKITVFQ
ncbi:MAG: hypothetical protein JW822_06330 [Spirochaetales bacterium]|nr:hypothetical protein [Spirochaetales bacterium]